jgi:hypothetical protein
MLVSSLVLFGQQPLSSMSNNPYPLWATTPVLCGTATLVLCGTHHPLSLPFRLISWFGLLVRFKTFELNPISLNQKFAKQISIFRSQPKSHFSPISMAAQPNSITFSQNWPTCHPAQVAQSASLLAVRPNLAHSLFSFRWPKPPPPISDRCCATLSQRTPPSSRVVAPSSPGPAPSVSPSLGIESMLKNRHAINRRGIVKTGAVVSLFFKS